MEMGSRDKLVGLLKSFDNAMLVTAAQDGSLHSRPMALLDVEPQGDLWFITNSRSGKVDEIAADSHVNVSLQKDGEYASVSGRANVLHDRAKIGDLWSERMRVYFPTGKDDPDLALIHVHAESGQYWDHQGAQGLKYLFEAAKAYVTGKPPDFGKELHASAQLGSAPPAGPGGRPATPKH